jgi:hypothetical protein
LTADEGSTLVQRGFSPKQSTTQEIHVPNQQLDQGCSGKSFSQMEEQCPPEKIAYL